MEVLKWYLLLVSRNESKAVNVKFRRNGPVHQIVAPPESFRIVSGLEGKRFLEIERKRALWKLFFFIYGVIDNRSSLGRVLSVFFSTLHVQYLTVDTKRAWSGLSLKKNMSTCWLCIFLLNSNELSSLLLSSLAKQSPSSSWLACCSSSSHFVLV
jgi:hypothetical protein